MTTWRLPRLVARSSRVRRQTRALYREWVETNDGADEGLVHPLWTDARKRFADLVRDGVQPDFLVDPFVRYMLYRTGFGDLEEIELAYMRKYRGRLQEDLRRYREPGFGSPLEDCEELSISTNALNKLYYAARISDVIDLHRTPTMLELGGGYGLLSQVMHELIEPLRQYVLVDLPELLALQFAYLSEATDVKVIPHFAAPRSLDANAIHLVPIHLLEGTPMKVDLFVSTFALSETPRSVHRFVTSSEFFGASAIYVVGQNRDEEPWRQHALESLDDVQTSARALFPHVRFEPFPAVNAWELTAWRPDVAEKGL